MLGCRTEAVPERFCSFLSPGEFHGEGGAGWTLLLRVVRIDHGGGGVAGGEGWVEAALEMTRSPLASWKGAVCSKRGRFPRRRDQVSS